MPAEWQARQLLSATSEPEPLGNIRSPVGKSTVTDFSDSFGALCAARGTSAVAAISAMSRRVRVMRASSDHNDVGLFDDIAHEASGVPIRCVGLLLAGRAGAANRQHAISPVGEAEGDL